MNKHPRTNTTHDTGTLAEGARALMVATANVAGEKVGEARERLAAMLESAEEVAGNIRDKAVAGARMTDEAVRNSPYKALAISAGAGALVGFLLGLRVSSHGDRMG